MDILLLLPCKDENGTFFNKNLKILTRKSMIFKDFTWVILDDYQECVQLL